METPRADLIVLGDVVVAAERDGLETADAVGIAQGRVVSVGDRETVTDAAAGGARILDASGSAVIPGLHDAHLHLADLARARRSIDLAGAADFRQLLDAVARHSAILPPTAWVLGRGWSADSLDVRHLDQLQAAVGARPAFLQSRDGHSAWASQEALRLAGVDDRSEDRQGGLIERSAGRPNGILRETAVELVRPFIERLSGPAFSEALAETVTELRAYGLTGVTDAGDFTAASGRGSLAPLGDSVSALAGSDAGLAGKLRVHANLPSPALEAAVEMGVRSGDAIGGARWVQLGWVKVFADGALGSRTAALFDPYSCETAGDPKGILTTSREELEQIVATAHAAGVAVAVHAIGDRANAMVIDVLTESPSMGAYRDRIEHVQLVRPEDQRRLGRSRIVASMQPVHCPADREAIERCWVGREDRAYACRSLSEADALLAFGSDAPVEPVNPWLGMFAAVHRRYPGDPASWRGEQSVTFADALAAYTIGPALAAGRLDQGHLRPGATADLAVLDRPLDRLTTSPEDLEVVRAQLTMVMGEKVE